jgi:hypothetical protein
VRTIVEIQRAGPDRRSIADAAFPEFEPTCQGEMDDRVTLLRFQQQEFSPAEHTGQLSPHQGTVGWVRGFQNAESCNVDHPEATPHQAFPQLIDSCIQLRQFRHDFIPPLVRTRLRMGDTVEPQPPR